MTISAVALVALHAALAQSSQAVTCGAHDNPWTPSEVVWSTRWDERGPSPYSAAASATTVYVFVENTVLLPGMDSLRDGAMVGLAIPRRGNAPPRVIATPPGHWRFRFPKIAVDDSGVLHMIWVEETRAPDGEHRSVSVWAARYRNEKWTSEKLTDLEGVWWTETGVSDIVRTANGELHLSAPDFSGDPYSAFLYVTLRGGRWTASRVRATMGAAYTTLATRHDSLLVGLIGPAPVLGDVNSVWLAVSPDAGRSWQPPVLVSRSHQLAARELRIVAEESGPISIVWAQKDQPMQFPAGVVRIARSRDNGRTWSAPSTLKPQASRVYVVSTALRAPGVVDALFSGDDALTIARACGLRWGKAYPLKDSVPSAGPAALHAERGQRPEVFWDAPALDSTLPPTRYWMRSRLR